MSLDTETLLILLLLLVATLVSAILLLFRYSIVDWLRKNLKKPDYQVAYETSIYQQAYDKLREHHGYVPHAQLQAELCRLEVECEEMRLRREEAEHNFLKKKQADEAAETKRKQTEENNIQIMSRSFSKGFVTKLETFLQKHPETLADLLSIANLKYRDEFDDIVHRIDSYLKVLGYLNNYMVDEHCLDGKNICGLDTDLETFLTHRNIGVTEATLLKTKILCIRDKGIPSLNERKEVREKWARLQYPIENILTTIHKKVVQNQAGV